MKIFHNDRPIPTDCSGFQGVVAQTDIKLTARSTLKAKVVIFNSSINLRRFWLKIGKGSLGRGCLGAVNSLLCERMSFEGSKERVVMEADPSYFCVIGLIKGHLGMEIICHEAVHAGFAYAKRTGTRNAFSEYKDFDEELVCYPAGRIASAINRFCHDKGLYD